MRKKLHLKKGLIFSLFITASFILSCEKGSFFTLRGKKESPKQSPSQNTIDPRSAPLPETIGANTTTEELAPLLVQGYGIVAGLNGKGSRECPEPLRKELISTIIKYEKIYRLEGASKAEFADAFLNSLDTAVVSVMGYIPPGALIGDRFDIVVTALPNTGTISLEGGRLYTTELRIYLGGQKGNISSRPLAKAWGPIFVNPLEKPPKGRGLRLKRKGYVLNGGAVTENRKIYLSLNQPSYSLARAIEQKINSRFPPPPDNPIWRTAKALNPGKIQLNLPEDYRGKIEYFLNIVRNLYIRTDPAYIENKAKSLTHQILLPECNAEAISFAWEGMGRAILPLIQPLYSSSNIQAAFYSARAGAVLGDSAAVMKIIQFAIDPKTPYRELAIKTLGYCQDYDARETLKKLIDDKNIHIRLLAYQSLVELKDPSINPILVGEDNFRMDIVPAKTLPFIYATRTGQPKFVIFGRGIKLSPPLFYMSEDQTITITTDEKNSKIKILLKTQTGKLIKLFSSLDLAEFIFTLGSDPIYDPKLKRPLGIGLVYSEVIKIVSKLCKNGAIPAKFKFQQITPMKITRYSLERPEK